MELVLGRSHAHPGMSANSIEGASNCGRGDGDCTFLLGLGLGLGLIVNGVSLIVDR